MSPSFKRETCKTGFYAAAIALCFLSTRTAAEVTTFTDRTSWEAAASTFELETFDDITTDQIFEDGLLVEVGDFVLAGYGDADTLGETFNRIDAAPFSSVRGSLNGTTDIAVRVSDLLGEELVGFEIVFDVPVSAWGCDVGATGSAFRIVADGTVIGFAQTNGFFGFVDDANEYTTIRFDTCLDCGGAVTIMDDFVYRNSSCLDGTVNAFAGPITDTLFINGESRSVQIAEGEFTWGAVLGAPEGGSGKFAVHANAGLPTSATIVELPAAIGKICFPLFLSQGATPVAIWSNLGRTPKLGASQYLDGSPIDDPAVAPTVFLQLFSGDVTNLTVGTVLTLQGVQVDPGSSSSKGVSITNAVMLEIL